MTSSVDKVFADLRAADAFMRRRKFEKYRFEESGFYCLGATIQNEKGYELTIAFNISDDDPGHLELCINFLNRVSKEQIRTIGNKVAIQDGRKIILYEEPDCISLVSYFSVDETDIAVHIMLDILDEIDKVLLFVVNI